MSHFSGHLAHKVILPPKKNYIPQFLKQRDINSYYFSVLSTRCRVSFKRKGCWGTIITLREEVFSQEMKKTLH